MNTPSTRDRARAAGRAVRRSRAPVTPASSPRISSTVVVPDHGRLAGCLQGEQAILQDLLGAQLVAAMHQRDVRGDVGQIERLLDRGVAAADHGDRLAAIEESVAGRAGRDAPAAKALFGRQAEVLGRSAGGDDQGVAGVFAVVAVQPERPLAQLDPVDVVEHDVGVEALGMAAHALHQRRTLQTFDVAGPIVDVGRGHELAALFAGR